MDGYYIRVSRQFIVRASNECGEAFFGPFESMDDAMKWSLPGEVASLADDRTINYAVLSLLDATRYMTAEAQAAEDQENAE